MSSSLQGLLELVEQFVIWQLMGMWAASSLKLGNESLMGELLVNLTIEAQKDILSINQGNMDNGETTFLALRNGINLGDLASWSSPGEVASAVETLDIGTISSLEDNGLKIMVVTMN